MSKTFHITGLQVSDFKKITAVRLEFDGNKPIVVSGDNGAGKSSLIDSMFFALNGKGAEKPIRDGATKAKVVLKIAGADQAFEVERVVTAKGGASLKVTDGEGRQVPKAQTFLDAMFSDRSIDPLAFMHMKPKDQIAALKSLSGVGAQIDAIDAEEKRLMEDRRVLNGMVKSLEAQLDAIQVPAGAIPDREVDVAAKASELSQIADFIAKANEAIREHSSLLNQLENLCAHIVNLEEQLAAAKESLAGLEVNVLASKTRADQMKARATEEQAKSESIKGEIARAQETNRAVQLKARRKDVSDRLMAEQRKANEMTDKIEKGRAEKVRILSESKLPVKGLTFTEDGLFLDGTPFQDLNTASQIRACCAIAMAEKPALRIIHVKEAALCNRTTFTAIAEMAAENDYELIAEHFSEQPIADAIHIVDGEVVQ